MNKEFDLKTYGFLQTFTGKKIVYPDIRPEQIDIRDIAHSHSIMARYNGHGSIPFSVACHCLAGVDLLEAMSYNAPVEYSQTLGNADFLVEVKKAFLMHDAAECYVCDFPRPMKAYFNTLGFGQAHQELEDRIFKVIALKYGIRQDELIQSWVDIVDDMVGIAEGSTLYKKKLAGGWVSGDTNEFAAEFVTSRAKMSIKEAEKMFLLTAEELGMK